MRTIDADELLSLYEGEDENLRVSLRVVKENIKDMPTIESEPVRHGKWIKENKVYPELPNDGDYYWYCSECRGQDQHNINVEVPFCWHCGAKMDEE